MTYNYIEKYPSLDDRKMSITRENDDKTARRISFVPYIRFQRATSGAMLFRKSVAVHRSERNHTVQFHGPGLSTHVKFPSDVSTVWIFRGRRYVL